MSKDRSDSRDLAATLTEALRERLRELGNSTDASSMQRYMKSSMPFRGVRMTVTRPETKRIAKAYPLPDEPTWRGVILTLWDDARYREERYAAIELAKHSLYRDYQTPDQLDLYAHLIVTGAWWDLVDSVATRLVGPIVRAHHDMSEPIIRDWANSEDLWLRRSAIICQLQSKEHTDMELLEFALVSNLTDSIHGQDFFIRKAFGWALRQHARIDPAWVSDFVARHEDMLSPLSRREALKHIADG